jgi:hypothetical protein
LRAIAIEVDPLVVFGSVGEARDAVLGDEEPVGGGDLAADQISKVVEMGEGEGHVTSAAEAANLMQAVRSAEALRHSKANKATAPPHPTLREPLKREAPRI